MFNMEATRRTLAFTLWTSLWTLFLLLEGASSSPVDTVKLIDKQENCVYKNVTYKPGQHFRPEPCSYCHCPHQGGKAHCAIEDCLWEANCVRYQRGPEECCGTCVQYGCRHSDGNIYAPGTTITKSACETCVCPPGGGRSQCTAVRCPRINCVDPVKDPGECCFRCPNGPNCYLEGRLIPGGKTVQPDRCSQCKCPDVPLHHWKEQPPRAVCEKLLTSKC